MQPPAAPDNATPAEPASTPPAVKLRLADVSKTFRNNEQAVEALAARRGSLHEAQHEVMECLGEMVWASQRSGMPPDGHAYLDAVRRRATR